MSDNHALQNAQAGLANIEEMVAALGCAYDRLAELREARRYHQNDYEDAVEDAQRCIQEDPLSIQVRGGWHDVGEVDEPAAEFEILLTTGGPALRIRGDLGQHSQPLRPRLEYQDWGTPWTELICTGQGHDALQTYCEQFYFGD